MNASIALNRAAPLGLCLLLVAFVGVGCGGPGVAAEEQEQLDWVQSVGGKAKIENEHIVEVSLNGTSVADADLAKLQGLSQLQRVVLYNTSIGDAGLEQLSGLPALKAVDISATQVTQQAANSFAQQHPGVTVSGPGA